MLRMLARRRGEILVSAGGDQVLFGMSLPGDTVIHDIKARVDLTGSNASILWNSACFYGLEGWILPVLDPDGGATYDAIWDQLVPKDTDVQVMDLDTSAQDTSPFFEPGEADWSSVLDVGLRPEKVYGRYRMLTVADGALLTFKDSNTPFLPAWNAGESVQIRIKRRLRVRQPSVLVFAVATPVVDDTDSTLHAALLEDEWNQVKYAGNMLERAVLHLFGVTEAGAETPWEEATALLQKHLESDMQEENAGSFVTQQFTCFFDAKIDHSVVGELGKVMVSTGR